MPEEDIEIQQIFESIDNLHISDKALIRLINQHGHLFNDLMKMKDPNEIDESFDHKKQSQVDFVTKTTFVVESRFQDEHLKNFEKRSKNRTKQLEVQNIHQSQLNNSLEEINAKYQSLVESS